MPLDAANLLASLTDAQAEAVTHMDGPLLVLAGPGSGKTTVVTRRVAHLVSQGIPAWQILALTFTNKASGEMRDRIDSLLDADVPGRRGLTVATFHSFCARLMRRYANEVGVAERFSIYDGADQRAALKQAISAADLSERNFTPAAVGAAIGRAKNRLMDAEAFAAEANDFYTRSMARAYTEYTKILVANDALDFDDLLLRTAHLLREHEGVRAELQSRFQYVLVDEYQDTNHAQFVIANTLASVHRNLCVVGDPDQSIYGWRGADIRNILEFEQHYPEAKIVPLGENFRSTAFIVQTADHLIRHNKQRKHKPLHTRLGDGDKPQVVVYRDERHEAESVVREFKLRHDDHGIAWKDMAVLYRMNALSRVLEESFRDAQIPYVIARGTAFYERKEIKDALAYLRLVANPNDEVSLRRIINTPTRGIGKTTLDRIELFGLNGQMRLFDALRRADSVTGVSARAASAVKGFVQMIESWRGETPGGDDGLLGAALAASADDAASGLADLVERVVRESGMEALYRRSQSEEDLERLENLEELINAAAQFVPVIDEGEAEAAQVAARALALETRDAGGAEAGGPETVGPEAEEGEADGPDADGPVTAGTAPPRRMSRLNILGAYLESVALVSDADAIDPANGAVTLMTLHAAKGLEFDAVTVVGLEQGLLPHHRAAESERELEEERRLCFVGITRAKRSLLLSRAAVRTHRGLRERTIESQFLRELPADAVVHSDQGSVWDDGYHAGADADPFVNADSRRGDGGSRRGLSLLAAFPAGAVVQHPKFGRGRVETVTPRPAGSSARVHFDSVGLKTLILEYAKLERIG